MRALTPQPFAGDDGRADPELARALAGHAGGVAGAREVVAALAGARVLVPVVAVLGDEHPVPTAAGGDAGADLALAILTAPDGRRALPVFTATTSLAAWDCAARPVPVEAARAAQSAVAEGCDLLVLDAAGPIPFVVSRPAVWAIGQGRVWLPAPSDPEVGAALVAALDGVPHLLGVRSTAGESAEVAVELGIRAGLDDDELDAVLAEVRRRLAADRVVAERVDSLELRVLPA